MERQPSPPRHKASSVIHIRNLVRPFTVNQLKELLARTGKITDFWIDNIKSKCYCQVSRGSLLDSVAVLESCLTRAAPQP